MPSSFEKAATAVAKAALNAQQATTPSTPAEPRAHKPRVSRGRAMLLGAGLMLAGQALVKSKGRDALASVRHGLAERIDGTPDDDLDVLDDDEDSDQEPETEDAEYDDGAEESSDQEEPEDEGPPRRKPRHKSPSPSRGRSR